MGPTLVWKNPFDVSVHPTTRSSSDGCVPLFVHVKWCRLRRARIVAKIQSHPATVCAPEARYDSKCAQTELLQVVAKDPHTNYCSVGPSQPFGDYIVCQLDNLIFSMRSTGRICSFQEDTTVGELEVQWTACLHSLCRRLRIVVPEGDGQGLPDPPTTEAGEHLPGVRGDAEDETYSALVPLTMKRRMLDVLSTEGDLLPPNKNVAKDVVNRSAENSQSRSGVCCEGGRSSDSLCRREIRVSAMPSSANQNTTEASVRLDRRLARVGARVPWGRRQRGRFAKVMYVVVGAEAQVCVGTTPPPTKLVASLVGRTDSAPVP